MRWLIPTLILISSVVTLGQSSVRPIVSVIDVLSGTGQKLFRNIPREDFYRYLDKDAVFDVRGFDGKLAPEQKLILVRDDRSDGPHQALARVYRLMMANADNAYIKKAVQVEVAPMMEDLAPMLNLEPAERVIPDWILKAREVVNLKHVSETVIFFLRENRTLVAQFSGDNHVRNALRETPERFNELKEVLVPLAAKIVEHDRFEMAAIQVLKFNGAVETRYFTSGMKSEVLLADWWNEFRLMELAGAKIIRFIHTHPGAGRPLSSGDIASLAGRISNWFHGVSADLKLEIYAVGKRPDVEFVHAFVHEKILAH